MFAASHGPQLKLDISRPQLLELGNGYELYLLPGKQIHPADHELRCGLTLFNEKKEKLISCNVAIGSVIPTVKHLKSWVACHQALASKNPQEYSKKFMNRFADIARRYKAQVNCFVPEHLHQRNLGYRDTEMIPCNHHVTNQRGLNAERARGMAFDLSESEIKPIEGIGSPAAKPRTARLIVSNSKSLKPEEQEFIKREFGIQPPVHYSGYTSKVLFEASKDLVSGRIMRFELDPTNNNRMRRCDLHIIANKRTVFVWDEVGGNIERSVFERLCSGSLMKAQIGGTGPLLVALFEGVFMHNEKTLDVFDASIKKLGVLLEKKMISKEEFHERWDELWLAVDFMSRKTVESGAGFKETLGIVSSLNPNFFNRKNSVPIIASCNGPIVKVTSRAEGLLGKLVNLTRVSEAIYKEEADEWIKSLTLLIGYSAPPIIADLIGKYFLHVEDRRVMAAGLVMAVGAHFLIWNKHSRIRKSSPHHNR